MHAKLYESKTMYHNDDEVGAIYYGDVLLWRKPVIRKYNFSHVADIKYNYYRINKARLFKDYENPELDRIKIEYYNYNMFQITQTLDTNLFIMPTNKVHKEQIYVSDIIQINEKNKDAFFIDDNKIIVHDNFGNYLGSILIPLKGEIKNILVDFDNNFLYVFLDKTYGNYSISKYSFKKDNFYSEISE